MAGGWFDMPGWPLNVAGFPHDLDPSDIFNHVTSQDPDALKAKVRAEKQAASGHAKGEHQRKLDAQGETVAKAFQNK